MCKHISLTKIRVSLSTSAATALLHPFPSQHDFLPLIQELADLEFLDFNLQRFVRGRQEDSDTFAFVMPFADLL
jgi:hypothetical protein